VTFDVRKCWSQEFSQTGTGCWGLDPIQGESILLHIKNLKLKGRTQETATTARRRLVKLAKLCDITNPYEVMEALANHKTWSNNTKRNMCNIYSSYLKTIGKTWEKPQYKKTSKLPFIPTERELDELIASAPTVKTTASLIIMKETGARIGEIARIKWVDLDTQRKLITIAEAEKRSNPRTIPVTNQLLDILNQLPRNSISILGITKHSIATAFYRTQENAIKKLQNPRLKQIHPHTFRHWKGTTEYHKTKDIMHVKYVLGHKSVETTQIYINLDNAIFKTSTDEFYAKTARTEDEAIQLIEIGFEYVTDMNGIKLFRKRK